MYTYYPNLINSPFFTEKGQICTSINYSSEFYGQYTFDYQSAFAILDKIAIIYNYSFADWGNADENDDFHKHKYQEIGLGYFRPSESIFRFENFVGYGNGKSETRYDNQEIKGKYVRIFMYPSIGISTRLKHNNWYDPEIVELGIASRICNLTWKDFEHNFRDSLRKENYYFEPAIFVRTGWQNIQFQAQYGKLYSFYKDESVESPGGWVSFGIISYFDLY